MSVFSGYGGDGGDGGGRRNRSDGLQVLHSIGVEWIFTCDNTDTHKRSGAAKCINLIKLLSIIARHGGGVGPRSAEI